jgi:hypothetical protein
VLDTWLYLAYYIIMKYKHKERVFVGVWICFVLMIASGVRSKLFVS